MYIDTCVNFSKEGCFHIDIKRGDGHGLGATLGEAGVYYIELATVNNCVVVTGLLDNDLVTLYRKLKPFVEGKEMLEDAE